MIYNFEKIKVIIEFIVNKRDFGGAPARIRTADLLITNQLLYQLSYKGINTRKVFNVKSQINQYIKDLSI